MTNSLSVSTLLLLYFESDSESDEQESFCVFYRLGYLGKKQETLANLLVFCRETDARYCTLITSRAALSVNIDDNY